MCAASGVWRILVWYIETNKNSTTWLTIRIHVKIGVCLCMLRARVFFFYFRCCYCCLFDSLIENIVTYSVVVDHSLSYCRTFTYCKKNSCEFSVQLGKKTIVVKDTWFMCVWVSCFGILVALARCVIVCISV